MKEKSCKVCGAIESRYWHGRLCADCHNTTQNAAYVPLPVKVKPPKSCKVCGTTESAWWHGRTCAECQRPKNCAKSNLYYAENKEQCDARNKQYAIDHAPAIRVAQAAKYAADPEPIKARSKAWRLAHPEKTKEYNERHSLTRPSRAGRILTEKERADNRAYRHAYYLEHKERLLAAMAVAYAASPKRAIAKAKKAVAREAAPGKRKDYLVKWHADNKEIQSAKSAEKYRVFGDKIRARQIAAYAEDPTRFGKASKKWKLKSKDAIVVHSNNRRARKVGADGSHTKAEWHRMREAYGNACIDCGVSGTVKKMTEAHLVPLSRGGSNWAWNLAPSCSSCNSKQYMKIHPLAPRPWQPRRDKSNLRHQLASNIPIDVIDADDSKKAATV